MNCHCDLGRKHDGASHRQNLRHSTPQRVLFSFLQQLLGSISFQSPYEMPGAQWLHAPGTNHGGIRMPVLGTEIQHRRGMIRGRESRNHTATTKLTETEWRLVDAAATADAKTTGEWLRDLALSELKNQRRGDSQSIVLSETIGVRLLLVNVLRSLATGQIMVPEVFDKLLDEIGVAKHELAEKLVNEPRR